MSISQKIRVFLAGTSFRTSYGGPAISIAKLAQSIAELGIEVGLWAPDGTATKGAPLPPNTPVQTFDGPLAAAAARFGRIDVVHDNGLWLPHNHGLANMARKRGVPRVISTRGMLEPWALNHKRLKKTIAWHLYQKCDLVTAQQLHATSAVEAENIAKLGLKVPVHVIPNGVDVPGEPLLSRDETLKARKKIALFLGRIYPVKGLPMLVDAWGQVRPSGWELHIAGPDENGHRREVEQAISRNGLTEAVRFLGLVKAAELSKVYGSADLFVLPSYSESFGMSIAEALAHGLPVLTTTAAPWPELVSRGCGWRVSPTVEAIAQALRQLTSYDAFMLHAMGLKGRNYVAQNFGWRSVAAKMVPLYKSLS